MYTLYPPHSKTVLQQQRFVLESALSVSKSGVKGFLQNLMNKAESALNSHEQKLARGSSLKAGSSPLSSPQKTADIRKEIELEGGLSHLHL